MNLGSSRLPAILIVCVVIAIAVYQMLKGTGALSNADAERLVRWKLKVERNRVEAIAPDGEVARAPASAISHIEAIGCPKRGSSIGRVPGRFGGGRTYGQAAFECLFAGKSPSGTTLLFSAYVHQTADPSVRNSTNGRTLGLLKSDRTRKLMLDLGRKSRVYSRKEQAALWSRLARDGIYVPADKTQKSPMQKAMDRFKQRITTH